MTETVLVVDDSTFIVDGLMAILKKNYRTLSVAGGAECLEVLKKEKPDIIILDILMEPMDGWETLENIRANPETKQVPVLMFSAKKISPAEAEQHRLGIDGFITKPVNPKQLLDTIANLLERQRSGKQESDIWKATGIPLEKIEESRTLQTLIDVDTSLVAVMKKQLNSGAADEQTREELSTSITAIEERLQQSRSRADELLREAAERQPEIRTAEPPANEQTDRLAATEPPVLPPTVETIHEPATDKPEYSTCTNQSEAIPPPGCGPGSDAEYTVVTETVSAYDLSDLFESPEKTEIPVPIIPETDGPRPDELKNEIPPEENQAPKRIPVPVPGKWPSGGTGDPYRAEIDDTAPIRMEGASLNTGRTMAVPQNGICGAEGAKRASRPEPRPNFLMAIIMAVICLFRRK